MRIPISKDNEYMLRWEIHITVSENTYNLPIIVDKEMSSYFILLLILFRNEKKKNRRKYIVGALHYSVK